MLLKDELKAMQENYAQKPMRDIRRVRPDWMRNKDPMARIYTDKKILFRPIRSCLAFFHMWIVLRILFTRRIRW